MTQHYRDLLFTPSVQKVQEQNGKRLHASGHKNAPGDKLGPEESAFIGMRDSFYMASTGESGWPYIQHRGGPPGFVKVLDASRLAFPDFRGNRQYISLGNVSADNRVSLFFMDYANRARLKLLGRVSLSTALQDPGLAEKLALPTYKAHVERAIIVTVEAFDWNCPQHIEPRYPQSQVLDAVRKLQNRIDDLESELRMLKKT